MKSIAAILAFAALAQAQPGGMGGWPTRPNGRPTRPGGRPTLPGGRTFPPRPTWRPFTRPGGGGGGQPTRPPRQDPCGGCEAGQDCTFDRTNTVCSAWRQNCRTDNTCDTPPDGCFTCGHRTQDPCAAAGRPCQSSNPRDGVHCGFNLTRANQAQCCSSDQPGNLPASCFGCFSRLNPPSGASCSRPTQPGGRTRPAGPGNVFGHCGDFEIDDADSCDKFCSDPSKHDNQIEIGKWTQQSTSRGSVKECCCLNTVSQNRSCCYDTDRPPASQPSPQSCSLFGTCAATFGSMIYLDPTGLTDAVRRQYSECDADAPAGSPELDNCAAVEDYVKGKFGTQFGTCCGCVSGFVTQIGRFSRLGPWAKNATDAFANLDCDDDDDGN